MLVVKYLLSAKFPFLPFLLVSSDWYQLEVEKSRTYEFWCTCRVKSASNIFLATAKVVQITPADNHHPDKTTRAGDDEQSLVSVGIRASGTGGEEAESSWSGLERKDTSSAAQWSDQRNLNLRT